MPKAYRPLLPAFLLLTMLVAGSFYLMIKVSLADPLEPIFSLTLTYYQNHLSRSSFWMNALYSLYLAVSASLLSTVIGTITAYAIATSEKTWLRQFSEKVMQAGMILPYLYVVFLAFLMLGQAGFISRLALMLGFIDHKNAFPALIFDSAGMGMIWVYAFKGIPFVTVMTLTVMTRINRQYQDVARTFGASRLQRLLQVYLPLSRRVILWSCLVLFAYALGSFEVPHLMSAFRPRPLSAELYSLYLRPGLTSLSEAMALGVLMLVLGFITAGIYLGTLDYLLRNTTRFKWKGLTGKTPFETLWLTMLSVFWLIPMGYVLLFSFFAAIPFPELLPRHFSLQFWESTFRGNPMFFRALLTSLQLAAISGFLATLLGLMTARSLSRLPHNTSVGWFAFISLPLFAPAVILTIGLHLLMLRLALANSKTAVVLAHVLISLPYSTAILTTYLVGIGSEMEEVARTLGCNVPYYYRKLLLPLLLPGLFLSFCIGFLLSFSELFSVLLLGGGNVLSFSMLMYPAIMNSQWGTGAVMGSIFLSIHLLLFFLADRWVRRSVLGTDYLF